jgi:hypothetical protein
VCQSNVSEMTYDGDVSIGVGRSECSILPSSAQQPLVAWTVCRSSCSLIMRARKRGKSEGDKVAYLEVHNTSKIATDVA